MHYVAFRFSMLFGSNRDVNSIYMYPQFTLLARLMVVSAGSEEAWGGSEEACKTGYSPVCREKLWLNSRIWPLILIYCNQLGAKRNSEWPSSTPWKGTLGQQQTICSSPSISRWQERVLEEKGGERGSKWANEQDKARGRGETGSEEMKRIPQAPLVN